MDLYPKAFVVEIASNSFLALVQEKNIITLKGSRFSNITKNLIDKKKLRMRKDNGQKNAILAVTYYVETYINPYAYNFFLSLIDRRILKIKFISLPVFV